MMAYLSNYGTGIPNPTSSTGAAGGGTTTINLNLDGQKIQQVIVDNTGSGMPSSYDRNKLTAW